MSRTLTVVSVHLTSPHTEEYDILSRDQTVASAMDYFSRNKAEKVVIKNIDETPSAGTLVLNADGTWAYHSSECVVHPINLSPMLLLRIKE